jgi:hypothetical protein
MIGLVLITEMKADFMGGPVRPRVRGNAVFRSL